MNKKCFILVFAIFAYTVSLKAQIMLGPVSGLNISKGKPSYIDPDQEAGFSSGSKFGFHFGATADIPFGGRFGLQPSIMFSQKGSKLDYIRVNSSADKQSYSSNHTLNYIEIPLLFKYKFGTPEHGLAVMAGPNFAFGINGKNTELGVISLPIIDANGNYYIDPKTGDYLYGNYKINESEKDLKFGSKINSNYKGFDMGFTFGLGGYFEIGEAGKLIIEARYTLGVGNILNNKYISAPDYDDVKLTIKNYNIVNDDTFIGSMKNRNIQLSIGYLFEL